MSKPSPSRLNPTMCPADVMHTPTLNLVLFGSVALQMEGMVNDLQMAKEREKSFEGEQGGR